MAKQLHVVERQSGRVAGRPVQRPVERPVQRKESPRSAQASGAEALSAADEMLLLEAGGMGRLLSVQAAARAGCLATPFIDDVQGNDPGAVVNGMLDAPAGSDEAVRICDALTGENLGTATVTGKRWTFQDPRTLSCGRIVVYIAHLVDAAGNAGTLSNAYDVIIAPTRGAMLTMICAHAGASSSDFDFDMGARIDLPGPSAVATVTDVTGAGLVSDGTGGHTSLMVSGTLSAAPGEGETVRVFDGASDLGIATVNGTTWTFQDVREVVQGQAVNYTSQVADAAGNLGQASSIYMMTIDAAASTA